MNGLRKLGGLILVTCFLFGSWFIISLKLDGNYLASELWVDLLMCGSTAAIIVFLVPYLNQRMGRKTA